MPEIYEHLPGFQVTYKDGGLVAPIDGPTTGSVLVIGTATDGPIGQPISFPKLGDAESIFGKYYNPATRQKIEGCSLVLSALEAYGAGCRDIRLVRYGGEPAVGVIKRKALSSETGTQDAIRLTSIYNGSIYNQVGHKLNQSDDLSEGLSFKIEKPTMKSNSWAGGKYLNYQLTSTSFGQIQDNETPSSPMINLTAKTSGFLSADKVIYYKVTIDEFEDEVILYIKEGATGTPVEFAINDTKTLTALISEINLEGKCGKYLTAALSEGVVGSLTVLDTIGEVAEYVAVPNGKNADVLTIEDLISAINNDIYNNVVTAELVIPKNASAELITLIKETPCEELFEVSESFQYLTQGADFVPYDSSNYVKIYEQLYKIYELIGDYQVDSIVLTGVYGDDKVYPIGEGFFTTFGEQFANYCADINERNYEVFGTVGMRPSVNATASGVSTRVKELINYEGLQNLKESNHYFRYNVVYSDTEQTFDFQGVIDSETGQQKTVGQFINVVAMPELFFVDAVIGTYSGSGAAAYAGLVSSLNPESAPTNKIIPNAIGMRYSLSPSQLNDLTGFRYVTFRQRHGGAIVVTDACTAASPLLDGSKSDYSRLSTLRITFAAVNVVRSAAEPFIGEPNETPQHNALNTAIRSGLDSMKKAGALNDYRFSITADIRQKILGEGSIDLEIIPALELRRIRVSVALRPTF